MNIARLIRTGLVVGGAASLAAAGAAPAIGKEAAAAADDVVLDLGAPAARGSGGGAGKATFKDFSFASIDSAGKAAGSLASSPGASCPSSTDTARWKAPELHSTDARAAAAAVPPGPACLSVKSPRDAASGLATGKRSSSSSSSSSSSRCVKGQHIAEAHLTLKRGVYTLTDVTVVECPADGMVLSFASSSSSSPPAPAPAGVRHEVH